MKLQFSSRINLCVLAVGVAGVRAFAADTNAPAAAGVPKIQFASTVFDFDKVVGGLSVRHDYYFTNLGTATLKITSVNTSCGCTTAAEWTREVPPGGTGNIPL